MNWKNIRNNCKRKKSRRFLFEPLAGYKPTQMTTTTQRHFSLFLVQAALIVVISITVRAQVNPFDPDKNNEQEKTAARLFHRALNFYRAGDYWQSSREMAALLDHYPSFSRADETYFTLGNCLNELGMLNGAAKMYRHILKKFIYSRFVPQALLGLQRVNYKKGALSESLTYYDAAKRGNPSREILDIANYYAGLTYYKLGDYPKSIQALSNVSIKSPYYHYVLYNLAESLLRMQRVNQAIEVFNKLFELPIINDDRRRVVNEAHLTLGYLYYELGYFERSIEQYDLVTPDSDIYPAALLASGWSAAQMKVWHDAIDPLTRLYKNYETNDATQEGLFLLGRCYLKMSRFDEAIAIYDHLINLFQDSSAVITTVKKVSADIKRERQKIMERKAQLQELENQLVKAINGDASFSSQQTDVLQDIQKERQELQTRLGQLDRLATATAVKEERRNWRAYAEYGKIRASFLKRRQIRKQAQKEKAAPP